MGHLIYMEPPRKKNPLPKFSETPWILNRISHHHPPLEFPARHSLITTPPLPFLPLSENPRPYLAIWKTRPPPHINPLSPASPRENPALSLSPPSKSRVPPSRSRVSSEGFGRVGVQVAAGRPGFCLERVNAWVARSNASSAPTSAPIHSYKARFPLYTISFHFLIELGVVERGGL